MQFGKVRSHPKYQEANPDNSNVTYSYYRFVPLIVKVAKWHFAILIACPSSVSNTTNPR